MDTAVHAQLMAGLCSPSFARLILQIPVRFAGQDDLARKLISLLAHADQMTAMCNSRTAKDMLYGLAQRTLDTATAKQWEPQSEGASILLRLIAHADSMSQTVSEAADGMFDVVRPIVAQPLPVRQQELSRYRQQQYTANAAIRDLSFRAVMERIRTGR